MNEMYKRIEDLCKARGVNMTAMCREAGVPRSNLSDLKYGRTAALATVNLDRISKFFDVPIDYLLGKDGRFPPVATDILLLSADNIDTEDIKKTADQKVDGLRGLGYDELTPDNQKMIADLIDKLLRSQSGGQ